MAALPVFDPTIHPHRRYNPLTGEHVLVSPHRTKRPWQGQTEPPQPLNLPEYDPKCYLCPGNARSGGEQNPGYDSTLTFPNDFPAILDEPAPEAPPAPHPLLTCEPVRGGCDVIIFHPRHDLTLARLAVGEIERVISEWTRVYVKRGMQEGVEYVQIFENKGAMMGCSNPHPHGQVWSMSTIPSLPELELSHLLAYSHSSPAPSNAPRGPDDRPCLLCEYAHFESLHPSDRVVFSDTHFIAVVPYWATWPFEVLLLPYTRHITSLLDLTPDEKNSFARALSRLTKRYDNLFQTSFAYSMGIHQRPTPGLLDDKGEAAHLHLHFYPPLLRSATVRKFLVGFEMMAEPQRDLTPEQAAARLRECSEVHYLDEEAQAEKIHLGV